MKSRIKCIKRLKKRLISNQNKEIQIWAHFNNQQMVLRNSREIGKKSRLGNQGHSNFSSR